MQPLLKILRQQGSSWRARVDSGLVCPAPPLYLRTLTAVRDCTRSAGAADLEACASAILRVLECAQPPGQGLDIPALDIIERAVAALAQRGSNRVALEELAALSQPPRMRSSPAARDTAPAPWLAPREQQWEGLQDELDQALLPVFLEEAQELMSSIGEGLEALRQGVADAELAGLARPLHTLKGSARMVGARRLSHCLHQMETALRGVQTGIEGVHDRSSATLAALETLLGLHDLALDHFAALTQAALLLSADGGARAPVLPAPLIRIRTTVLDKLLNQVGEVSIARSRLDNEVGSLQSESKALGEQLMRLSGELRQSGAQAQDGGDAVAAMQALAHSLAARLEQASLHQRRLQEGVSSTREGLRQQAAHTRELQQELMYARMVKFNSMEVRMQHLVRQVAAETGKPLALDLSNCRLQIDRAILERLMGPLEHLLRNAAVHGIESAEQRLAEGKPAVGRLTVQATHEGNEAVIRVSDDGRGLDLEAIRQKALELGAAGLAEASQARLADLIFQPGLSTSPQVSALAGRGIGMDVVRSEVAALGGWMRVHSQPGQGVQFTLYLPLSLAVQHVCLLRHGQQHFAIPSMLVDSIVQLRGPQARQALAERSLEHQGSRLPLHPWHCLLDEAPEPAGEGSDSAYVLLIKRDDGLMAVLADHVSGNREVVVKPVGPQLATLAGVVGATVLGDGQIVLIINPLLLAGAGRTDGMAVAPGVQ
ncbi:chemotaxis protein CheA [Herbaspirillum seropedicae]|uniref:chemotaxis protein CheA n=1 Tax=Herbaspirillum seropedicae TaxID=964 RepID=UPI001E4F0BB2|nr:chemotaxis protein CheW [Herbaspirillum seropedicae]